MGLMDMMKKKLGATKDKVAPPPVVQEEPEQEDEEADDADDASSAASDDDDDERFDLAGFDPDDEEAFFDACNHMKSEGQFGGTDESRAEIMARYGIRDRRHWQTVRDSVFAALTRKYGSHEEVSQRQWNWNSGQSTRHMQQQVATAANSADMQPVEGIALQAWAAFNASIVAGTSLEDILKAQGIDRARWDRASAEWNARMARDTTFAITMVYGEAFQNASKGKYGDHAREATAARAANRDLAMDIPMTVEQYWEILMEQSYASKQGKDPIQALKDCGLSIIDWTDLSSVMGYYINRTTMRNPKAFEAMIERVKAKFEAKYPAVKAADLDIQF